MTRTPIIRIRCEIHVPYTKEFGSATTAEAHCVGIRKAVDLVLADASLVSWDAQHTTTAVVDVEPRVQPSGDAVTVDDTLEMPAYLRRTS